VFTAVASLLPAAVSGASLALVPTVIGLALSPSHRTLVPFAWQAITLNDAGALHGTAHGGQPSRCSPRAGSAYTERRGRLCDARALLKTTPLKKGGEEHDEKLRRAEHLRNAIEQRAQEQGHKAPDIARMLDISVGHWYRLRQDPLRLDRIDLPRVGSIARYIGWPRVRVLIAIGWLEEPEVDQALSGTAVLSRTLRRLEREGIAGGVVTPLERAAPDHQVLMAKLLLIAESRVITPGRRP
jgi:hypothetical protein